MWTAILLHSLAALVLIIAATQLIDWVFSGMKWTHTYYAAYPEIWRPLQSGTKKEMARVVWISFASSCIFALAFLIFYVVLQPGIIFGAGALRACIVAAITWLAIPFPLIMVQHGFIKFHWVSSAAAAGSWFFKLLVASFIVTYII
jgi:hypothetical protein